MQNNHFSTKKKILVGSVLLLAWLGFVVEGVHALYSDVTSMQANSITSGGADLLISNSQSGSSTTFAETRPGFELALAPGETTARYFLLKNGTDSTVDLQLSTRILMEAASSSPEMAAALNLEYIPVDAQGIVTGPSTTVNFFENSENPMLMNQIIHKSETRRFQVVFSLDPSYDITGRIVHFDMEFTGNQNLTPENI